MNCWVAEVVMVLIAVLQDQQSFLLPVVYRDQTINDAF